MLKKIIMIVLLSVSSISAIDFDAIVPLTGAQLPAGNFYTPVPFIQQDIDLVLGFSAVVPARKTEELDVDLKFGVNMELPLLGKSDVYFNFANHDGVIRRTSSSDFYTQSLDLGKSWVYPLSDRIELGAYAVLGQILLNGEYQVVVLPRVIPVLKLKVNLF